MIITAFVIFVLLIFLGLCLDKEFGWLLIVWSSILLLFLVAAIISSAVSHLHDIGTIRGQAHVIRAHDEQLQFLHAQLQELQVPSGALLNADTPYKSVVEAITNASRNKTNAALELAEARRSIVRRGTGPFWFIVSIYGQD